MSAFVIETLEYVCACAAVKTDINTGIKWNDNWEEI